jgi:1-deoxy-D-xylulose-5-phosphate synthase
VEDNGRSGGFGDAVCRLLRDVGVDTPCKTFGLPQEFLDHGPRDAILDAAGLSAQHLARQLTEAVARRTPAAGVPGTPGVPGAPDAASAAETAGGPEQ